MKTIQVNLIPVASILFVCGNRYNDEFNACEQAYIYSGNHDQIFFNTNAEQPYSRKWAGLGKDMIRK
jgi:hypothetical protein